MQHSYAEDIDATCPQCKSTFKKRTWLLINSDERADLAQEISDGTLDLVTCPACTSPAGYLDTPLLLYQPVEKCPLYFFPPRSLPAEETDAMLYPMLRLFHERVGNDARMVVETFGVIFVPREMLPYIFMDEVKAKLAQQISSHSTRSD